MKIMQVTTEHDRTALHVDFNGVTMMWLRPKVGGGYYIDQSIAMRWPWRRG